jgi:hypothetical protein
LCSSGGRDALALGLPALLANLHELGLELARGLPGVVFIITSLCLTVLKEFEQREHAALGFHLGRHPRTLHG